MGRCQESGAIMESSRKRAGYAIAIAGCASVLACRLSLSDVLLERAQLFPFLLAVTAAAWWGGRGPGVAATFTGAALGVYFVVPPPASFRIEHLADGVSAAIFALIGLTISHLCGQLHEMQNHVAIERALKEADARKDRYIATLAHELRNPLAAISSALQLWRRVPNDAAELENLRAIISRHLKQLVRLTDDLLDVARISSGKILLRRSTLNLDVVIAESVEAVWPAIFDAGHDLSVAAGDAPIFVEADQARLRQVLVNLLQNAAKYTPAPGVISVRSESRDGRALIRVRDNGAGIAEEQLSAIFDPFYQVESALGSSQGGLGIGLTLCRQLLELHGGAIEAHSQGPGKGSEFVVTLPAAAPPTQDDAFAPPTLNRHAADRFRILVVDDLRDCAETLVKLLQSLGHEAISLYDGQAAIDWTLRHRPDVVLMDVAMPGLDGYDAARQLRRQPSLKGTTLVAVTGFGRDEDRRRAAAAGFDFHVTKPVDIRQLETILAEVSERRQPVTEAAVSCTAEEIVFTDTESFS